MVCIEINNTQTTSYSSNMNILHLAKWSSGLLKCTKISEIGNLSSMTNIACQHHPHQHHQSPSPSSIRSSSKVCTQSQCCRRSQIRFTTLVLIVLTTTTTLLIDQSHHCHPLVIRANVSLDNINKAANNNIRMKQQSLLSNNNNNSSSSQSSVQKLINTNFSHQTLRAGKNMKFNISLSDDTQLFSMKKKMMMMMMKKTDLHSHSQVNTTFLQHGSPPLSSMARKMLPKRELTTDDLSSSTINNEQANNDCLFVSNCTTNLDDQHNQTGTLPCRQDQCNTAVFNSSDTQETDFIESDESREKRRRKDAMNASLRMLPIMLFLGLLFAGMCVAMNLFSRARFKNNRSIFSNPRIIKLARVEKQSKRRRPKSRRQIFARSGELSTNQEQQQQQQQQQSQSSTPKKQFGEAVGEGKEEENSKQLFTNNKGECPNTVLATVEINETSNDHFSQPVVILSDKTELNE